MFDTLYARVKALAESPRAEGALAAVSFAESSFFPIPPDVLLAPMALAKPEDRGLALGAWGASQATAAGLAIGFSGVVNDLVSSLAVRGAFGEALADPVTGYGFVYAIEIVLLFATLVAIGPLVRSHGDARRGEPSGFAAAYPAGLKSGGL